MCPTSTQVVNKVLVKTLGTMRCTATTRCWLKCKRNCIVGTDFCKQHNPLNTLDDITCAICLDPITDPMKMNFCTHVFCKNCISKNVIYTNMKCPMCREGISPKNIHKCISHKIGKRVADKITLMMEIRILPHKWFNGRPWTKTMEKRFLAVFPHDNPLDVHDVEYMRYYLD